MKLLFLVTSMMFMVSNHPFSMISLLILVSITISMFTFQMMSTSWFSYIFLLIMLSGMLMIFMYMATLSSNESFTLSLIPAFLMAPITVKIFLNPISSSSPQTWTIKQNLSSFSSLTILMVMFLFVTMVTVTKISTLQKGPLFSSF
uniref:NADH dehydrogenase subunit 6 n=1 Tax=Liphistius erawan TaxID=1155480 RepID=L7NVY1_LIPER|nr:NADH dehydrogenase subunit 6 [Liphistius erawan]AFC77879.1 NADH dehydrogenase subunit 6 [Liphistius erawan]